MPAPNPLTRQFCSGVLPEFLLNPGSDRRHVVIKGEPPSDRRETNIRRANMPRETETNRVWSAKSSCESRASASSLPVQSSTRSAEASRDSISSSTPRKAVRIAEADEWGDDTFSLLASASALLVPIDSSDRVCRTKLPATSSSPSQTVRVETYPFKVETGVRTPLGAPTFTRAFRRPRSFSRLQWGHSGANLGPITRLSGRAPRTQDPVVWSACVCRHPL